MKRRAAASLAVLLAIAAPSAADDSSGTIEDGKNYFQLTVPTGWTPVAPPDEMLLVYQSPDGRAHLSVGRVPIGRGSDRERDKLVADILAGIESATPGFRLERKRLRELASIPVLDVYYRRRPGTSGHNRVVSRLLLYRRHAVILSIGLDRRARAASKRAARAVLASFVPYLGT